MLNVVYVIQFLLWRILILHAFAEIVYTVFFFNLCGGTSGTAVTTGLL
jgi:hypothetical protein